MMAVPVAENFRLLLYPRLLQFGVDYGDLLALEHALVAGDWSGWSAGLAERAEDYRRRARTSHAQGRNQSAATFFRRACDAFHFASMREPDREARATRAAASVACFASWRELACPSIESFGFEHAGTVAEVQVSPANGAPVVLLIGGLDSAKECELWYFSRVFATRGLGVAIADLPGQGPLRGRLGLVAHGDSYVRALVAELIRHTRASRMGVFGVSLGGYLALRAAAVSPQLSAVVSLGGFFDHRAFANLRASARPLLREAFLTTAGKPGEDDFSQVSLATSAVSLPVPALIMHSENDHLVSLDQAQLMAEWAPRSELRILSGAEHVATSRFPAVLPEIGDWMTDALSHGAC